MFLTLLLEGLLALLLLTLAPSIVRQEEAAMTVVSLDPAPVAEQTPAAPEPKAPDSRSEKQPTEPEQAPPQPAKPQPLPPTVPLIPLSNDEMAAADISAMRPRPAPPAAVARPVVGPSDSGTPRDTQRVAGQGPHGEPLYAASWYREPYADELRGYLATAQGPGWGLIACRTVPDYRVEDCVPVDEYPAGSNIVRAVLAAAWQFRVRPPRIGGQLKTGEWVQIRIDYDVRRR